MKSESSFQDTRKNSRETENFKNIYIKLEKELESVSDDGVLLLKIGAVALQIASLYNDKYFCKKSKEYLWKALILIPHDYNSHLLYGSTLLLEASLNSFQFSKMKLVTEGIEHLKKAVELSDNRILVRIFVAKIMVLLPPFFNMTTRVIKELEEILKEENLGGKLYFEVLIFLGYLYKRVNADKLKNIYSKIFDDYKTPNLIKTTAFELFNI